MNALLLQFLLFVTLVISIIIAAGFLLYYAYRYMGEEDIIFTFLEGGTGKVSVRGKSPRKFSINGPGLFINDPNDKTLYIENNEDVPDWEIITKEEFTRITGNELPDDLGKSWWTRWLGLYPIGLWPIDTVMTYYFSWTEWVQPEGELDYVPKSRVDKTRVFYVKSFPYFSRIKNIFIKGNLKFDIEYLANLRVTNPKVALFDNEDWLAKALAELDEAVRDWAAVQDLEELLSQVRRDLQPHLVEDKLTKQLQKECGEFLKKQCGCTLSSANFLRLVDENETVGKLRDSIEAVGISKRQAEAKVITATAEAEATLKTGLANAQVIEAQERAKVAGEKRYVKAYKKHKDLAATRAFQGTGITTYVQGGAAPGLFITPQKEDKKKGESK